ncbi:MAG: nuclear transport factor 2 family protein [Dehalococcoidia bacterium]
MDIESYNRDWLKAWSDKDVERLLTFYAPDTVYKDQQVPQGARGHVELRKYLESIFGMMPETSFDPEQIWAIEGGYVGRWIATSTLPDGSASKMRGFDLVLLDGDQITLNEVYTHNLP